MTETERMLMLLDGVREQIAAGRPTCYLFAWASPPVPVNAAPGRIAAELNVPFVAPPPDATIHLLLSFGADAERVVAAHRHVGDAMAAAVTTSPDVSGR